MLVPLFHPALYCLSLGPVITITELGMDEDDFAPDPALAAALGFSAFGTQPNAKRRKYNTNDAVVGIDPVNGANSLPLGIRPPKQNVEGAPLAATVAAEKQDNAAEAADGANVKPAQPMQTVPSFSQNWDVKTQGSRSFSHSELAALREGVRLPGGTVTYFLPSFIEDPWTKR